MRDQNHWSRISLENKEKLIYPNLMEGKAIKSPRVRIAPSPTGTLHIGTARAALFNYLYAKANNGKFILRIEDTDLERSSKEFEQNIIDGLKWLKITWDEGPNPENPEEYLGEYGPYRQSERKDHYRKYIEQLLDNKKAYHCFCTKEELEAQKQYQMSAGLPPHYSGTCCNLNDEEVAKKLADNQPSIIRFRVPHQKLKYNDLLKGKIEFDTSLLGDIAIARDLNTPLYNLAVVIDDHEMDITHVLRGEDHISNTPKQILLFEALELEVPKFGHLPLILGPDKSKLSKRHGDVSVSEYKEKGYLSETMINFMALLGWNPGTEKEIFSLSMLVNHFSLDKCQKSPAMFNQKRLDWLNGFYIRQMSIKRLTEKCIPHLLNAGLIQPVLETGQHLAGIGPAEIQESYFIKSANKKLRIEDLEKMVLLYQERLKYLGELPELIEFFFKKDLDYAKDLIMWKETPESTIKDILEALKLALEEIEIGDWSLSNIDAKITQFIEIRGLTGDRGQVLWPMSACLTGKKSSAPPYDIAAVLGKEKTIYRINQAIKKI